jgi:hypothetical protein
MEVLLIIMVFARPAISASTFALVFIGSALEMGGGLLAQVSPSPSGVPPGAGLVMAYTGLVTAVGGLILGILQILAANRKADALTMIQLATLQAENERLKKEVAENKGWLVTVLNKRHGEELGPEPTFDPDPATATPQALKAASAIPDLLKPSPPLPLPIPEALKALIPTAPATAADNGQVVDAIKQNTEVAQKTAGAVEDIAKRLP